MINPKNNDVNNDATIVGTDFFTDSESFLNELTDDELHQVIGGKKGNGNGNGGGNGDDESTLSLLICDN